MKEWVKIRNSAAGRHGPKRQEGNQVAGGVIEKVKEFGKHKTYRRVVRFLFSCLLFAS